jgi:hypothetical protein
LRDAARLQRGWRSRAFLDERQGGRGGFPLDVGSRTSTPKDASVSTSGGIASAPARP